MFKPYFRDKILAAGFEIMFRLGFNGCSVQDITDMAEVPKGSFYNHFKSKEAFGLEVIDFYCREIAAASLRILRDTSLPPLERIERHFEMLAKELTAHSYERGCFIANFSAELSDQSDLVRYRLSTVFSTWTSELENCLRDVQRIGEVRADIDASILASFLINAWQGTVLRSKVERNGNATEHFNATVFSLLLSKEYHTQV